MRAVSMLFGLILLTGLTQTAGCKPSVQQLRQKAARNRAKAAKGKVQAGAYLAACPGEDVGPTYSLPRWEDYGVSNGWDWLRWDGVYPDQWIEWLKLPRNTYYVKEWGGPGSGMPDMHEDQWERTFLVKTDAGRLAQAMTAQVPLGKDVASYQRQPEGPAYGRSMARLDVQAFTYRRVDALREISWRFETSPKLGGWTIMRMLHRRLIPTQTASPMR